MLKIKNNICYGLTKNDEEIDTIYIPEGVKEIAKEAFILSNIKEVILPSSLTKIGRSAFRNSEIESITFNSPIEIIDDYAFKKSKLESINCEVKKLGNGVFDTCYFLEKAYLGNSLKEIPPDTFNGCIDLETFEFPNQLEKIGRHGFFNADINNIKFPETLKYIGEMAFHACSNLEEIKLPNSLEFLGRDAFFLCTSLKEITFSENLNIVEPQYFTKDATINIPYCLKGREDIYIALQGNKTNIKIMGNTLEELLACGKSISEINKIMLQEER